VGLPRLFLRVPFTRRLSVHAYTHLLRTGAFQASSALHVRTRKPLLLVWGRLKHHMLALLLSDHVAHSIQYHNVCIE
jgi:hypothetical protein